MAVKTGKRKTARKVELSLVTQTFFPYGFKNPAPGLHLRYSAKTSEGAQILLVSLSFVKEADPDMKKGTEEDRLRLYELIVTPVVVPLGFTFTDAMDMLILDCEDPAIRRRLDADYHGYLDAIIRYVKEDVCPYYRQ